VSPHIRRITERLQLDGRPVDDVAVVETGLGGLLDATSVVDQADKIAVI
jgi:folylpolyglutamate synthase/dihydropteroate synthase